MSVELQYLVFAVFLLLLQMIMQTFAGLMSNGIMGLAGSRDDEILTTGIGGRFERAYYNMVETFPVFAALVLCVHVTESWNYYTGIGAQLYFWGRVAYVPAYIFPIPFVRTIIWLIALAGILLIAFQLLGLVT